MIAGCSVAWGAGSFVAVTVVVADESFWGTSLVDFVDHHPSPLLHALLCFCKWDNVVPMSIFCGLLGHYHGVGDCCNLQLLFCFDGGGGYGDWSRGNWPVFPGFK